MPNRKNMHTTRNIAAVVRLGVLLLIAAFGASCTMAPTYEQPEAPVPVEYPDYPEYKGVGADKFGTIPESRRIKQAAAAEAAGSSGENEPAQPEGAYTAPAQAADANQTGKAINGDDTAGSSADAANTPASAPTNPQPGQSEREKAWTGAAVNTAGENNGNSGALEQNGRRKSVSGPVKVEFDETPASGNLTWREFFTDPAMQRLIGIALENNRDLRMALLNVEKSRAMYQIQRAELLPSIQASGVNSNQRMPVNMSGLNETTYSRSSSATVGFTSYELDLFGRVRSLKDSALESYFAVTQNAHSAQVTLISEVASAYLTLVSYRELYFLTQETYNSRKESFDMSQAMFDQGLSSQLALNQARTSMEEARVAAAQYRTSMLRAENALAMLLGSQLPDDLNIPGRLSEIEPLKDVPEGLPSQLLTRRPDILAAEHTLKSANANIGAARASFFPRISLTGNLGYLSMEMDNLFSGASKTWSFAPSVSIPIFEGGRLLANLRVSEVEKKLAVASYEKAIQGAFREVSDALAFRSTATEQVAAATSLMEAARESYELSTIRYEVGVDSFLNVLDSQRIYFSARQAHINTMLSREINTLNLYKALGGGWE